MPTTYKLISKVTVGAGGAANIEFTSIPGTYTDLHLLFSGRCDSGGALGRTIYTTFNNSTSNYTFRLIEGAGSSVSSASGSTREGGIVPGPVATSSVFSNISIYVPNYASSNNKSYSSDSVMENNATSIYNTLVAGLWSDSSAINAIKLVTDNGSNFVQYSTARLYGIKNS